MARDLTAAVLAELATLNLRPRFFVEIDIQSGTLYLWSGLGDFSWNGQTWTGVGDFGGISVVRETADNSATNFILRLSGIPTARLSQALSEIRHDKEAIVYLGLFDSSEQVIVDPFTWVQGYTDRAEIEEAAEGAVISLNCESEDAILQQAKERRYTPEDQKAEFPDDKGFDDVPALGEFNLTDSGKTIPQTLGGSGGGGGKPTRRNDTGAR